MNREKDLEQISKYVSETLCERKLRAAELASLMNVQRQTVSSWQRGIRGMCAKHRIKLFQIRRGE